jgi:hypothetical protein
MRLFTREASRIEADAVDAAEAQVNLVARALGENPGIYLEKMIPIPLPEVGK